MRVGNKPILTPWRGVVVVVVVVNLLVYWGGWPDKLKACDGIFHYYFVAGACLRGTTLTTMSREGLVRAGGERGGGLYHEGATDSQGNIRYESE